MKTAIIRLILLCLVCIHFQVHAIRVPGLYEAEVFVEDQSVQARQVAMKSAMEMVLVKLTGDRNAAMRMELQPVIDKSQDYVLQYRYLEPEQTQVLTGLGDQLTINVRFDENNLNDALRSLGIQVWGRERPSTLIWIATQDESNRSIIQPETSPEIFNEIETRALERGIVLINPLFDLQDNSALRASDIWGEFHFSVRNASQRYYPDIVLTGKIESAVPGIWEGQWTVYLNDETEQYFTQGSYLEAVLREGVDGLADIIANNYSDSVMADIGSIQLQVVDIVTVDQYARVLKYFESLSPVTEVEVLEIKPGQVDFRISAHGGSSAVVQAINFGRILEAVVNTQNLYRVLP
ncbi:MAG: DUF2066 domain-containing protein [Gammaproteobacteria bacterium]|nr:DUF2066 domain-containing protein [Gammaproteobacteria bacterium]